MTQPIPSFRIVRPSAMSSLNLPRASEEQLQARAAQLWANFGHPTEELLSFNQQYHTRLREQVAQDDDPSSGAPATGQIHPRIYDIQQWTSNRLPRRPIEAGHPLMLDLNLHAYWHMFIEAAKRFDPDDPNQGALAVELLSLRCVTLRHAFADELVPAYASNGQKIWTDLPYLYDDLRIAVQSNLTRNQRTNLAAFIARLASIDLLDTTLFGLGLLLFRDALETPRPLLSSVDRDEASVQDLLPGVRCWMDLTRHHIESFVHDSFDGWDASLSTAGPLCPSGCPGGFHPVRWEFWGKRLNEFMQSINTDVASNADKILSWWKAIDTHSLGGGDPDEKVQPGRYWVSGAE